MSRIHTYNQSEMPNSLMKTVQEYEDGASTKLISITCVPRQLSIM